jgi:hypothetical protein
VAWISNLITVIGTLGGVFLGQYYTRKSQRDQWLLDNKKQEYRELLDALAAAHMSLMTNIPLDKNGFILERRRPGPAEIIAYRVMRDRIFIARDVEQEKLAKKWEQAAASFDGQHIPIKELTDRYLEVHDVIVDLALKSLA